jgi:hypothetical protein
MGSEQIKILNRLSGLPRSKEHADRALLYDIAKRTPSDLIYAALEIIDSRVRVYHEFPRDGKHSAEITNAYMTQLLDMRAKSKRIKELGTDKEFSR